MGARRVSGRSAQRLAGVEEGTPQQGPVVEAELAGRLQATVGAAGVDVAVLHAFVGPAAADPDRTREGDAAAASEFRHLCFDPVAVAAIADRFDPDGDDEGDRGRDRRVEVSDDAGVAVQAGAVEDGDRRGNRDRRLFGELDDGAAEALTDDRARAELAGLRHRRALQLARGTDRQPERLDRAVPVEFEFDRFQDRRQGAVSGADPTLAEDRDRRVDVLRQRRRREPAFADDEDVAGLDPHLGRAGESGPGSYGDEHGGYSHRERASGSSAHRISLEPVRALALAAEHRDPPRLLAAEIGSEDELDRLPGDRRQLLLLAAIDALGDQHHDAARHRILGDLRKPLPLRTLRTPRREPIAEVGDQSFMAGDPVHALRQRLIGQHLHRGGIGSGES